MYVYLQLSSFVDRGVQESEEALGEEVSTAEVRQRCALGDLVGDIWSGFTYVSSHLAHDTNMLITVQQ